MSIVVENLVRTYETTKGTIRRQKKSVTGLDGVSFSVAPGELFGLVGPNGAGKTTLIKILTTLLLPTSGKVEVLGYDERRHEREIRKHINFIFGGERGLYNRVSGYDNLRYFADLYKVNPKIAKTRCEDLLHLVGLWGRHDERVEGYSKGMKQRLHIAKLLINDPQVVFLDEPTIGLDPVAARTLRDLIRDMQGRGITILLTSHYMEEMEQLCDRIAVLRDGKFIELDTPVNLKRHIVGLDVVELQLLGVLDDLAVSLQQLPYIDTVSVSSSGQSQTLRVQTHDAPAAADAIRNALPHADLSRLVIRQPNLEDAYVRLMERS
jgi:ABC-2 type transport system ATP-binding protein